MGKKLDWLSILYNMHRFYASGNISKQSQTSTENQIASNSKDALIYVQLSSRKTLSWLQEPANSPVRLIRHLSVKS